MEELSKAEPESEPVVFAVLDVETTGLDPNVDRVVEIACVFTAPHMLGSTFCRLVNPGRPISPEASAVHHLVDADVADAQRLDLVVDPIERDIRMRQAVPVAHRAEFDSAFLPTIPGPWLDTLRMARRYLPDSPQYGNQYLRYALKLEVSREVPAHRALGDALVTAALLRHLLNGPARADYKRLALPDFLTLQARPILLRTVGFGKYKGKPWADVPQSYLRWLLDNPQGDDRDQLYTVRKYAGVIA